MKPRIPAILTLTTTLGLAQSDIVINEIMYNSDGPDVEFVELYNASEDTIALTGWRIVDDNDGHTPCRLNGSLAPGAYWVIAADRALFQSTYSDVDNLNDADYDAGDNAWELGNGGDAVRLLNTSGEIHDEVTFDDGGDWPASPDGNGPSLELLHPGLDNALPTAWDPSAGKGGTPGRRNSVYTTNTFPVCKNGERDIALPKNSDRVLITVQAYDMEGLYRVELLWDNGNGWTAISMRDDGNAGDPIANDSLYTTAIPAQTANTLVKYYARATDRVGQTDTWPNNAPEDYHAYTVDYEPPKLRINEVLAINNSVNPDEAGEYDDWFEIRNMEETTVSLNGMFVGNGMNDSKGFQLPDFTLAAGDYLLIWADGDTDQGLLHAPFRLASEGEAVAIFETVHHGNVRIHGWKYGRMSADVSMGYLPEDGTAPEYLGNPTPGASNAAGTLFSDVCINEFQCTSDFGGPDDWIEIYNRGNEPFDISDCFLSDSRSDHTKWKFPQNTVMQPGDYIAVHEDVLNFGLSSAGDDIIMLTAKDSLTGLDFYDFDVQLADKSEGRSPDGVNTWIQFDRPTKQAANDGTSSVLSKNRIITGSFQLNAAFPNPFNLVTAISYKLSVISRVKLDVFDCTGRQVQQLVDKKQAAGFHRIKFDGSRLPSGVYFYRLTAESDQNRYTAIRKMTLVK